MEFKDRIKDLRIEKNLSFSALATIFKKTESAIRAWKIGRTKPDADTLIKLAEYFDCTADYLLGLSEFRNKEYEEKNENEVQHTSALISLLPLAEKQLLFEITKTIRQISKNDKLAPEYYDVLKCVNIFFKIALESPAQKNLMEVSKLVLTKMLKSDDFVENNT